jgi:hypothetical protein
MASNLSHDVPAIEHASDPSLATGAMGDALSVRARCGWVGFVPRAREALRRIPPPAVAYAAADTPGAARQLCAALHAAADTPAGGTAGRVTCVAMPERHVSSACFGEARRGAQCQRVALLELYMLAASASLIFSASSSFSSGAPQLYSNTPHPDSTHTQTNYGSFRSDTSARGAPPPPSPPPPRPPPPPLPPPPRHPRRRQRKPSYTRACGSSTPPGDRRRHGRDWLLAHTPRRARTRMYAYAYPLTRTHCALLAAAAHAQSR